MNSSSNVEADAAQDLLDGLPTWVGVGVEFFQLIYLVRVVGATSERLSFEVLSAWAGVRKDSSSKLDLIRGYDQHYGAE
jgi:hypothetical protein